MVAAGTGEVAEPRWTVITGASSGIGAELARVFAGQGRSLVIAARRQDRLEALAEELRAKTGVTVEAIACDLEQSESPDLLMRAVEDRGIVIDTLVNTPASACEAPSPNSRPSNSPRWWRLT
jgi:uncharacterized protein